MGTELQQPLGQSNVTVRSSKHQSGLANAIGLVDINLKRCKLRKPLQVFSLKCLESCRSWRGCGKSSDAVDNTW